MYGRKSDLAILQPLGTFSRAQIRRSVPSVNSVASLGNARRLCTPCNQCTTVAAMLLCHPEFEERVNRRNDVVHDDAAGLSVSQLIREMLRANQFL